ncbi:hypothetical protein O5537_28950, partial [Escherichia coli]|nr:hypothetical protein [Escherichia coli]
GETIASGERLKRLAAVTGKPEHWFFMPLNEHSKEEDAPPLIQLDDKEKALLSLFNQLPETEKLRHLNCLSLQWFHRSYRN